MIFKLIFLLHFIGINAIFYKCPVHQLYFEKVLGHRPAVQLSKLLVQRQNGVTSLECWETCNNDLDCSSFIFFLSSLQCFGFTRNENSEKYQLLNESAVEFITDSNVIYFEKICLDVPKECKSKLWPIVRIPGNGLLGQGYEQLKTLVTRRECAQRCISEIKFKCLSALFTVSKKNNYARQSFNKNNNNEEIGQCALSREDRSSRLDSFRVSTMDEEYIENQCIERDPPDVFCSFEQYLNSTFIYSDLEFRGLTQKQCQEKCSRESRFNCQGVSYFGFKIPVKNTRCFLHSEDTISLGPRSILFDENFIYMRRVKCLNLTVICDKNEMAVKYVPSQWFFGRIYVNLHTDECSTNGKGSEMTELKIPIGNEIRENRCGIIRAYEINGPWNRTLISTLVVIQKNPFVQTQGDRLIKVGCILNNNTNSGGVPDDISLGSSIEFRPSQLPNQGSLLVNKSIVLPKVSMKIIDLSDYEETKDVQLGQNLEFILSVDPPDGPYDIRAINLIATSENRQSQIHLLDDRGCPKDATVFPSLKKIVTEKQRRLSTRFNAFKFVDSPGVNFEVMIHFCENECPIVDCGNQVYSYGRRRKRSDFGSVIFPDHKIVLKSRNAEMKEEEFGPVVFPSEVEQGNKREIEDTKISSKAEVIGPVVFPGDVIKEEVESAESYNPDYPKNEFLDKINDIEVFDEQYPSINKRDLTDQSGNRQVYQTVIGKFNNRGAKVLETSRNNFTDNKRILKKTIEVPLTIKLNVHNSNAGEMESLIYGENSQILVAGFDADKDNLFCINLSLLVIILIFFLIIQIACMTGCCILIKKYKKMSDLEEDRKSLNRIHNSLEYDRHVHWADQNSAPHFFYYT